MPCYSPPPPYQDEERENAEEAVKILCEYISNQIDNGKTVNRPFLKWFLEHKRIDLKIATDGYYGRNNVEDAEEAKRYIKIVELLI